MNGAHEVMVRCWCGAEWGIGANDILTDEQNLNVYMVYLIFTKFEHLPH